MNAPSRARHIVVTETKTTYLEAFRVQIDRDPDRLAVVCGDESITRRELDHRSNQVARALAAQEVGAGDLVAIVLPNGVDLFVTVVAAWKLGAVPLPLSHRLPSAELDAVLGVAQPAAVLRTPIDPRDEDASPLPAIPMRYWKAMSTGGSTGMPKVVIDESPPYASAFEPQNFMQVDGTMLVAGPLYHSGPFINSIRGLLVGNTIVLMERFDAERALSLIEQHRVDWAFLVPTMQHRVWRLGADVHRRYDVSSLRAVISSGGPYPAWLKECMIGWLGAETIQEAYGGTEQLGGCSISGVEALAKPGSVGRVRAAYEMCVRDESGSDLPAYEVGQIWFRAKDGSSAYRYLGRAPDEGAGWGSFGDLGHVDDDGYLFIADRRTDLIVTGGANVYPAEVEAAIESHPAVRSSAVIGMPDDDLGHRVHAIVDVGGHDDDGDPEQLIAAVREHLAGQLVTYKRPRTYEIVRASLRDEAGKVRRFALRAERTGNAG
ncbi:MAG: AMP-binding protein [Actinobacteria bacterium]|uniref:Unannotated protein n=1 Tax=freshwater metagenome TaxID=449393 RepID=A0A6J7A159_9ZZZZ|nr:AMP-binding protein [Actinomycetota bacterium]MSX86789.1 AMP-binding protein [Actinomycetota bacterium]MSY73524.1 AMP-binding protein [Actinomycetota bacterium]